MTAEEETNPEANQDTSHKSANSNASTKLDFWNVNIPPSQHTTECPSYLRYAITNDKDRGILETPDSDYVLQTWPEVRKIISDNRIDLFERLPSDLRKYRQYNEKLTEEYGSVMEFVMKERLKWDDLEATGRPFSSLDDWKILRNDWPYGLDPAIVHVVVWVKFELPNAPGPDEDTEGDLEPEIRKGIDKFVDETFVSKCGAENVIWFKNWTSLKSIHSVEHFHVMIYGPDMAFVDELTGNDVPLLEKVKAQEAEES